MDTTQYGESQYLTPQLVKESTQTPHKIGVIVSDAVVEDGKYGKQLCVNVSFDYKIKIWKMNRQSVKNMNKIGADSGSWLTKKVAFVILKNPDGKEQIIGEPFVD